MSEETPKEEAPAPVSWPVVVRLKVPLDFAGERITELSFRRGIMRDIKGMKIEGGVPTFDQLMLMASRMCGRPLPLIEMLDQDDAEEVTTISYSFFAKCLPDLRRLLR
jgi:hypothetical protein